MNELVRCIAITIGALLIFSPGGHVPLTGISTEGGVPSSGAIDRVSVCSLALIPYVGAAILVRLVSVAWGRVVEAWAPGGWFLEAAADHLDRVVSLTTVVGAVYLLVVSLIPEALVAGGAALPYKIGGGSMLIVVCTILDLKKQVRALSLTSWGAHANENNPSGTAGLRQGHPGATSGAALWHRAALHG